MDNYTLTVYLDNIRAGHAYLELTPPGCQSGEVFGFYPEKFDEKREVLFGKGMIRQDAERLALSKSENRINQSAKEHVLTSLEFKRALTFLQNQIEKPNYYFLIGYNCIDFIQDVFNAAKGEQAKNFLSSYSEGELKDLSWVGTYARLRKFPG